MSNHYRLLILTPVLLLAVIFLPASNGQVKDDKPPGISIKSVPSEPPGPTDLDTPITGTVSGAIPTGCRVVVYAYGAGTKLWYVQPTDAEPYTSIRDDHTWAIKHPHGGDEFVALLVKPSYKAKPHLTDDPQIGEDVLAIARKRP